MSYRDHYSDSLHDLVHAEAEHDYDPREIEPEGPTPQEAAEDAERPRAPLPSEEVAKAVREAYEASEGRF